MDPKNDKPALKATAAKAIVSALPGTIVLIYVGDGVSIPDVPARDLTNDDLADVAAVRGVDPAVAHTALIASTLYKEA